MSRARTKASSASSRLPLCGLSLGWQPHLSSSSGQNLLAPTGPPFLSHTAPNMSSHAAGVTTGYMQSRLLPRCASQHRLSPGYRAGSCRAPARALCTPPHTVARAALPKCRSVRIPLLLTASEAACHCSSLQSPSHGPRCSPSSPLASPLRPLGFATVASLPPRSTPCEPPPGGLGLTVQNTPPPGVPLIRGHLL